MTLKYRVFVKAALLAAALGTWLPGVVYAQERDSNAAVTVGPDGVKVGDSISVGPDGVRVRAPNVSTPERGAGVDDVPVSGAKHVGTDFSAQDLRGHSFAGSKLVKVNFDATNLQGVDFSGAKIVDVDFDAANLAGAKFVNSDLKDVDFDAAVLRNACFVKSKIVDTDFDHADLTNAVFAGSKRLNVAFDGAVMTGVRFDGEPTCPGATASRPQVTAAAQIEQSLAAGVGSQIALTVNFAHDSDAVTGPARAQVLEIANALRSERLAKVRVRIEGHTDSQGEENYNLDLSYRRAIAVARALSEEYGIASSRYEVRGFGESQPIASNDSAQGKALNRRVTLVNIGTL